MLIINGGKKLSGSIRVSGSKNAVLPLIAASLLTDGECRLSNVPDILDVRNFVKILSGLGASISIKGRSLVVSCKGVKKEIPDPDLVKSMRASIVLAGPLLSRLGKVKLAYPGGDVIGKRPVDVHLRAFQMLGAKVESGRFLSLYGKKLKGAEVYAESSVTGTENIILAAVKTPGLTKVKLSAQEPHVVSLCLFLQRMGAKINGIGTHTLTIRGVKRLRGACARVIPDMLEAGSFAILAAASKSRLIIENVRHSDLDAVYNKLEEIGVRFDKGRDSLVVYEPKSFYRSVRVRTGLYPNLATDLQPPFGVLLTQCTGTSHIHDWIFEGRLGYLKELAKMGARVKAVDPHQAVVEGPTKLHGANIESLDIRSGMTLLIAALVASGRSRISGEKHIDRGYERIEHRLKVIGADIERV